MRRKQALAELIAKVEAGEFDAPPSSARAPFFNAFMDIAEIALPQNVTGCSALAWRAYNMASLDAALALHQAVLPEWSATIQLEGLCYVHGFDGEYSATSDTPARAWLLAILKALHEMETEQ
jgi:hypothetical protein